MLTPITVPLAFVFTSPKYHNSSIFQYLRTPDYLVNLLGVRQILPYLLNGSFDINYLKFLGEYDLIIICNNCYGLEICTKDEWRYGTTDGDRKFGCVAPKATIDQTIHFHKEEYQRLIFKVKEVTVLIQ